MCAYTRTQVQTMTLGDWKYGILTQKTEGLHCTANNPELYWRYTAPPQSVLNANPFGFLQSLLHF